MGRGAALYDQFTGVIGVKRGSFAKDEEPDDAQAEWLEKT